MLLWDEEVILFPLYVEHAPIYYSRHGKEFCANSVKLFLPIE